MTERAKWHKVQVGQGAFSLLITYNNDIILKLWTKEIYVQSRTSQSQADY